MKVTRECKQQSIIKVSQATNIRVRSNLRIKGQNEQEKLQPEAMINDYQPIYLKLP